MQSQIPGFYIEFDHSNRLEKRLDAFPVIGYRRRLGGYIRIDCYTPKHTPYLAAGPEDTLIRRYHVKGHIGSCVVDETFDTLSESHSFLLSYLTTHRIRFFL